MLELIVNARVAKIARHRAAMTIGLRCSTAAARSSWRMAKAPQWGRGHAVP